MQTLLITETEAQHLLGLKDRANLKMNRLNARKRGQPLSRMGVVPMPDGSIRYDPDKLIAWASEVRPLGFTSQHEQELMELGKRLFADGRKEPLPDEGWEAKAHEAALFALGHDPRVFAAKARAWSDVGIKQLVKRGRTEAEATMMISDYILRVGYLAAELHRRLYRK